MLSSVLGYARDLELIDESPVRSFREQQSRRARSKRGRADSGSKAHPIEDSAELERLVAEAEAERPAAGGLKRAAITKRPLKDLRDIYASQLLTAGVPLAYISKQLGHANQFLTSRHYARWCRDDEDYEPMRRSAGEVWADLLAQSPHNSPHKETRPGGQSRQVPDRVEEIGARDRVRTGDPQLGKLMLYQLSYSRPSVRIARIAERARGFICPRLASRVAG